MLLRVSAKASPRRGLQCVRLVPSAEWAMHDEMPHAAIDTCFLSACGGSLALKRATLIAQVPAQCWIVASVAEPVCVATFEVIYLLDAPDFSVSHGIPPSARGLQPPVQRDR